MKKRKLASRESKFHLIPNGHSKSLPPLPSGHFWIRESYHSSDLRVVNLDDYAPEVETFKHSDSHITWELASNYDYTSPQKLLKEFRRHWPWYAKKPCAWVRNPEKNGIPLYGADDVIVAVYCRNFYIAIERKGMFGPHAARLFYRSYQCKTEIAWIAICQIEGMWHSDVQILRALNFEIRNKQLWHSKETAVIPVIE